MRTISAIIIAAAFVCFGVATASAQPADLIIRNARIWTGEPFEPEASALAVRRGRFVYVGADEQEAIDRRTGQGTKIIDAQGRRILPGLIDSHVHLQGAAAGFGTLDLRPATSREHFLQLLQQYAATLGLDEWVIGRGWSAESWPDPTPPTPDEIDKATNGRPAILTRMDGHSLIAGAEAMRRAGVTSSGPDDPPGGKIGRADDGAPTGAFYESAMAIVTRHAPAISDERMRELLKRAVRHANSNGMTQVGAIDTRRFVETHLAPLDRDGELTLRVGVSITGVGDTLEEWKPTLEWAAANRDLSSRVKVLGFKGYMDGSLGSRTAWMIEPYFDQPDNSGFPLAMVENGALEAMVNMATRMNLQPAIHAIGDRANQQLLTWHQLMGLDRWNVRPRIEHAQHLAPGDITRLARLSIIPCMQPYHKADDGRYAEERLGPDRIQTSYAFRSLYDLGVKLSFGSDWPVVTCNPFLGVWAAVTGKTTTGEVFVPDQSLTVNEALMCYTVNGSWALFSESDTGMIQPGFAADFIIIDRDILAIDLDEVADTRVLKTYLDGECVYDAEASDE